MEVSCSRMICFEKRELFFSSKTAGQGHQIAQIHCDGESANDHIYGRLRYTASLKKSKTTK